MILVSLSCRWSVEIKTVLLILIHQIKFAIVGIASKNNAVKHYSPDVGGTSPASWHDLQQPLYRIEWSVKHNLGPIFIYFAHVWYPYPSVQPETEQSMYSCYACKTWVMTKSCTVATDTTVYWITLKLAYITYRTLSIQQFTYLVVLLLFSDMLKKTLRSSISKNNVLFLKLSSKLANMLFL